MGIFKEWEEQRQLALFAGVGIGAPAHRRSSFSYHRLPEQLIKLTIIKLDATSFDVQIARTAAVWELKMAIENIFNNSAKDGACDLSWSHVWGHFCLFYGGFKLTDDRMTLRSFGIKDGEKLHFMRHVSLKDSKRSWRPNRRSVTAEENLEVIKENGKDKNDDYMDASPYVDEDRDNHVECEHFVRHKKSKLSHFLRMWFSNSRSSRISKTTSLIIQKLSAIAKEWDQR